MFRQRSSTQAAPVCVNVRHTRALNHCFSVYVACNYSNSSFGKSTENPPSPSKPPPKKTQNYGHPTSSYPIVNVTSSSHIAGSPILWGQGSWFWSWPWSKSSSSQLQLQQAAQSDVDAKVHCSSSWNSAEFGVSKPKQAHHDESDQCSHPGFQVHQSSPHDRWHLSLSDYSGESLEFKLLICVGPYPIQFARAVNTRISFE